ncbi:uncharacterized protein LOC100121809 [Nasonia vitripennis]|uniref:H15 domain-containing protein n=1 Tax=Nasonia vitripennis TaxID=7425 RepID=A0A7M7LMQ1_NASVI|nr:uncharacterized protein LOC100121809 [Nasonia vitripennis]
MPAAVEGTTNRTSSGDSPRLKIAAKAVGQVMVALKNSNNAAGPTMTEIVKFISGALFKPATKRQVVTALKRGVEFGILKRKKGHYLISSPEENFSKLPLPKKTAKTRGKLLEKVSKRARAPLKSRRPRAAGGRGLMDEFPSPPFLPKF